MVDTSISQRTIYVNQKNRTAWKEAGAQAAATGVSISEYVAQALREKNERAVSWSPQPIRL